MTIPQLAAVILVSFAAGVVGGLGIYYLIRQSKDTTPGEGIDGLHDALDSAGRDLPTDRLPRPGPGTVYSGSHRRKGPSKWVARLGRPHPRRHRPTVRHLP